MKLETLPAIVIIDDIPMIDFKSINKTVLFENRKVISFLLEKSRLGSIVFSLDTGEADYFLIFKLREVKFNVIKIDNDNFHFEFKDFILNFSLKQSIALINAYHSEKNIIVQNSEIITNSKSYKLWDKPMSCKPSEKWNRSGNQATFNDLETILQEHYQSQQFNNFGVDKKNFDYLPKNQKFDVDKAIKEDSSYSLV
jgi:hypothetical protein